MKGRIHDIYRPVGERRRDFAEVEAVLDEAAIREQMRRCHNCGIPFCHGAGCPLFNRIPDFNSAAANGDWQNAYRILAETSFFPEFTSRVCPALCEGSCCSGATGEAVMIRQCEKKIVETAFSRGWVQPVIPAVRNGGKIAVVGSGPSGLCAAEGLNRAGFAVTVFEANRRPGGLLRYGIPDFKLQKSLLDRRLEVMKRAGIVFTTDTRIGRDVSARYLSRNFDALVLALGTAAPRDLAIPGRELAGIHFALEFLQGQNRVNGGELDAVPVGAAGKRVLVIGGGDTGSDCVGTAVRQGAASVRQIEIMPRPPEKRSPATPWPLWPQMLRTSSSHLEGCEREWNIASDRFVNDGGGHVAGVEVHEVAWEFSTDGRPAKPVAKPGSSRVIDADLVLLAMGFTGVPRDGAAEELELTFSPRNTIVPDPARRIYAVGDCVNGASLVVRAMADAKRIIQQIVEDLR